MFTLIYSCDITSTFNKMRFLKTIILKREFRDFLDTRVPLTIALLKCGPAWLARNRLRPVDFPWNVDTTRVPAFVRSSLISGCWTGARILPEHNDNPLRIFMWRSSLKRTQCALVLPSRLMVVSNLTWKLGRNSTNFETVGRAAAYCASLFDFPPDSGTSVLRLRPKQ